MKKSLIIQTVLVLSTLLFLVYAMIQKGFAEEAKMEALAQKELANENARTAQLATAEANRQERIAIHQTQLADSLLTELNALKLKCK